MKTKNISIASLLALLLAMAFMYAQKQSGERTKEPYINTCSDNDRCSRCRIYRWQMDLAQGKIDQRTYDQRVKEEEAWIDQHCMPAYDDDDYDAEDSDRVKKEGDDQRKNKGENINNPPETVSHNKRDIFYHRNIDKTDLFTVRSIIDGKPDNEHVLVIFSSKDKIKLAPKDSVSSFTWTLAPDQPKDMTIFPLSSFYYQSIQDFNWCNKSNKVELPDYPLLVFFSEARNSGDKWLLFPSSKGKTDATAIELTDIKSNWFDLNNYDYYEHELHWQLSLMYYYADKHKAKLLRTSKVIPTKDLTLCFYLTYKGTPTLAFLGYAGQKPLKPYNPFEKISGNRDFKDIFSILVNHEKKTMDPTLESIFGQWSNRKLERSSYQIVAVLPEPGNAKLSPKEAIRQTGKKTYRILTETDDDKFQMWQGNQGPVDVKWLNGLDGELKQRPEIQKLALADPELLLIDHDKDFITFFFKDQLCLYSWLFTGEGVEQKILLDENRKFLFTGQSCSAYLKNIRDKKVTQEELDLFRRYIHGKDELILIDIFNLDDMYKRILLWTVSGPELKNNTLQCRIRRTNYFGELNSGFSVMVIDSREPTYDVFQQRYNSWVRSRIEALSLYDRPIDVECWMSNERFGIVELRDQKATVSVYLDKGHRESFENALLDEIISTILADKVIFKGSMTELTFANIRMFFESWLTEQWDRSKWRANPLGYLDRCNKSQ